MALTNTPGYPQAVDVTKTQYLNADGTGQKTIFTAGANGSKVKGVIFSQSSTSRAIGFFVHGAFNLTLAVVTLPATAGEASGTPSVNVLANIPGLPLDSDGQPFLILGNGDGLSMTVGTQVPANNQVNATVISVDY